MVRAMRSVARPGPVLSWLDVGGVIGLPDLTLELGPVTALVGPRGAGKSQLLSAIAWLLGAADRPPERREGTAHERPLDRRSVRPGPRHGDHGSAGLHLPPRSRALRLAGSPLLRRGGTKAGCPDHHAQQRRQGRRVAGRRRGTDLRRVRW